MSDTIKPGLHYDLPEEDYHSSHEWLSASGMRMLLPPNCPAKFKAQGTSKITRDIDFGLAAHKILLGKGVDLVVVKKTTRDKQVVDADDYATKSAQEHRDAIRAEGKLPILAHALDKATAMAEVAAEHPLAAALFSNGQSEVSAFWTDPATGVQCRSRFDYLPEKVEGRRLIVPDYKTAASAERDKFAKSAAEYGYHIQEAHYSDSLVALGIDDDPAFLFVVQEKEPPFLINVIPLHEDAARLGRALADRARRIFRECAETDIWPGYTPDNEIAEPVELPGYYTYRAEEYVA